MYIRLADPDHVIVQGMTLKKKGIMKKGKETEDE
jgi:hypothetical protein